MSTKFLSPGWRMPRNANQSKQSNYSMDFSGTSYVDTTLDIPYNSDFSVSFWFNWDQDQKLIITDGNFDGWSTIGFGFQIMSSGEIKLLVGDNGSSTGKTITTSAGSISANNWYHIVGVCDLNNEIRLYLNGASVDSTSVGSSRNETTNNIRIGGDYSSTKRLINGQINQVSIFDYALSPGQVTTLWGGGTSVSNPMALPSSPIAYYPLGTSAYNGEYLAENNAIGDYVFDGYPGGTKLINSNINQSNTGGKFTISFWQKPSSSGLVTFNHGGGTIGEFKYFSQPIVYLASNYFQYFNISTSTLNANTNWQHFVVFVDTTNVTNSKLWIDKTPITTASSSTGGSANSFTSGLQLNLGAYPEISNMMYFTNYEIDQTNVDVLYNNGSPLMSTATLTQAPNAWYKLDASEVYNSTTTEWSIDNNQNPSAYASSLNFNAQSLTAASSSSLSASVFSVSMWIKIITSPVGTFQTIFFPGTFSGAGGGSGFRFQFKGNGSPPFIDFTTTYSTGAEAPISLIDDGGWHHIVGTYDGSDLKLYIDKNKGTDASSSFQASTSSFFIGQAGNQNFSNVCYFNTALSQSEIDTLYNNGTPLTDMSSFSSLVSLWKLDNTTTGIQDSKGSNNLSGSGPTEYTGFVNALAGDSSGMIQANLVQSDLQTVAPYSKYALNFDGTDYIQIPYNVNLTPQNGNFTISAWINTDNLSGWHPIWSTQILSSGGKTVALHTYGNKVRATVGGSTNNPSYGGSWALLLDSTQSLTTSTWYHIAVSYDMSGDAQIYINGSPDNSGPIENPQTSWGTGDRFIGEGEGYWDGRISNLSIWNTDLTSAQVTELYNEGLPSNLNSHSAYSNLVSWWQLGENSSYVGGATNPWTFADEKGTNNGTSGNLPEIALTNGVGTTANGVSSGMSEGNLVGDAPYSTANALSSGMSVVSRVTGSGNTP